MGAPTKCNLYGEKSKFESVVMIIIEKMEFEEPPKPRVSRKNLLFTNKNLIFTTKNRAFYIFVKCNICGLRCGRL